MKKNPVFQLTLFLVLLFSVNSAFSQCEVFKSEIKDVAGYMFHVNTLTDSLSGPAEKAGYEPSLKVARTNAMKMEKILGKALDETNEAVSMVEESQYNSELCGLKDVISNTIASESYTVDARDFAEQAYRSAKNAVRAKNLGNLHYHIRIAHRLARELREASYSAAYHAEMAHYNCVHGPEHGMGVGNR